MRLIRLGIDGSFSFEEFFNKDRPKYAILSHRWASDEVVYEDFKHGRGHNSPKLVGCAAQARKDRLGYMWIDTCCIDKSSSSELSEAINSMYAWYASSAVCYAYLDDVAGHDFAKSQWFTRGWTLQELLAPRAVEFFDHAWMPIGNKERRLKELEDVTGIAKSALQGWAPSRSSVAERMYWASKRVTTRVEDIAYCLMGLFDVNMPLLYGEGTKAFRRLQEEIIRQTNDSTIFAWSDETEDDSPYQQPLAPSPRAFSNSHGLRFYGEYAPPAIENTSIRLDVLLRPVESQPDVYHGILDCVADDEWFASILLLEVGLPRWGSQKGARRFIRIAPEPPESHHIPEMSAEWDKVENIHVQNLSSRTVHAHRPDLSLEVVVYGPTPSETWCSGLHNRYDSDTSEWFLIKTVRGVQAALLYRSGQHGKILLLGLNRYGRPCCRAIRCKKEQSLHQAMEHTSKRVDDDWASNVDFEQYNADASLFFTDRRVMFRVWVTERSNETSKSQS